ncbi:MAG: hypothetical protein JKY34_01735, partial [Kordiimonadaceae bacterium]|nr:hypothetical protein [Kordiimonadaceae bacterium]
MRFFPFYAIFTLGLSLGLSPLAAAADGGWQNHQGFLQTRVIAASMQMKEDGKHMLAWEAKLAPGWKTYWRSPGEAGLPVRVFVGKKQQEILYPLPARFELFGLQTYGYSKYVMLPFQVDENSINSRDAIEVDFMVCKEICVPFRASYTLSPDALSEESSIHDGGIKRWLDTVPATEGGDGAGLDVISAKVVGPLGHQKIIVDVKASHSLDAADMLAEVNDMFHFGKPKMRLLADGKSARFVLPAMTGKKPQSLKGLKVRLTFTDGKGASVERHFNLSR